MEPRFINRIDLFPTPVWCFQFPDFESKKDSILSYVNRDEMYFTQAEYNGLQISEGNLHDKSLHPALSDVTDFFQSCFEDVMNKCGYEKDVGLTSMWSTKHREKGFHHSHIHANTYLAGVLYLYDSDGRAGGTVFQNPGAGAYVLEPRVNHSLPRFFKAEEQMPFIPGMALIFPSWALHTTPQNESSCRIVIAANCMPVGRSNSDHFHQYVFPKPSDFGYLPLKEHIESGYRR